jgi:hypothetical protein
VVILVGLGTYLVVFNLDNIVRFCSTAYLKRKLRIVEDMKNDHNGKWSETGNRFASFTPKQQNMNPSEWTVLIFALYKMFRKGRPTGGSIKGQEEPVKRMDEERMASLENWPNFPSPAGPVVTKEVARDLGSRRQWGRFGNGFGRLSMVFRRGGLSSGASGNDV